MSISTTIWMLGQWLLIAALVFGFLGTLIVLFHPLRFNLSLRGSLKGQRSELWFVYFFRMFGIGVIASPHTQDLVIRLLFWKRVIKRNQRKRSRAPKKAEELTPTDFPANEPPTAPPAAPVAPPPVSAPPAEEPVAMAEKELLSPASGEKSDSVPVSATEAPATTTETTEKICEAPSKNVLPEEVRPEKRESISEPQLQKVIAEETTDAASGTGLPGSGISQTTAIDEIKPLDAIDPFVADQKTAESEQTSTQAEKPPTDSFRQKLRMLRRRLSKGYAEAKKWLRLFGRKYRLLWPIFSRFWQRSRKGFKIENPAIACKYALHEPYLTGMFQGNLAILSGMLQGLGIEFVPVPVFTSPTIYSRAKASAVILPYRLVFALFALLFEKVLWREAWKLFKWYRESKSAAKA